MDESQTKYPFHQRFLDFLYANDIYTIAGGPNWDENYQKICDFSYTLCQCVTVYVNMVNDEVVTVKLLDHYG